MELFSFLHTSYDVFRVAFAASYGRCIRELFVISEVFVVRATGRVDEAAHVGPQGRL